MAPPQRHNSYQKFQIQKSKILMRKATFKIQFECFRNVQESGNHRQVQRQMSSKPSSFEDRGEARLILDLESAIANSPKFDLEVFRSSLESKDMYGNEQVSKQHVIQAANHAKLSIPRDVFGRWLMASDPINRGIYSIPKLVNFLERSQPNVISRVKTAKQLSKSHTNLSSTTSCNFLLCNSGIEFSWDGFRSSCQAGGKIITRP